MIKYIGLLAIGILLSISACKKEEEKKQIPTLCPYSNPSIMRYQTSDSSVVWFPNCFTPDADGMNDIFIVYHHNVEQINILITNPETNDTVFHSTDPNEFWDGRTGIIEQKQGVYDVSVSGTTAKAGPFNLSGKLSLLLNYDAPAADALRIRCDSCSFADQFNYSTYEYIPVFYGQIQETGTHVCID